MARADRRVSEYLADQARVNMESAPAPAVSSSSGGAQASGPAVQAPEEAGAPGGGGGPRRAC
eukprot:12720021-Alexandrium_andersonii.AAC.1